jgi:hypothetical protein
MMTVLSGLLRRTRQHHAIEHATLHVLAARYPTTSFSGYSDPLGFTIYASDDIHEEQIRRAVGDALLRLQAGEHDLAIHPNCGTNLATSAIFATVAAFIAGVGGRHRTPLDRITLMLVFVTLALIAAKPLGFRFQKITTLAEVADRWVADVRAFSIGQVRAVRVLFDA